MVPWRFMGRAFAVPLPKIEPYFARPGLPAQIRECGFQTCLCRRGFLIPEELRRIKSLEALPFALPRAVPLLLPPAEKGCNQLPFPFSSNKYHTRLLPASYPRLPHL